MLNAPPNRRNPAGTYWIYSFLVPKNSMNSLGALSDFSDFSGISDLGMAFIPFGTSEVWSLLSHHHLLEAVVRGPGKNPRQTRKKPDRGGVPLADLLWTVRVSGYIRMKWPGAPKLEFESKLGVESFVNVGNCGRKSLILGGIAAEAVDIVMTFWWNLMSRLLVDWWTSAQVDGCSVSRNGRFSMELRLILLGVWAVLFYVWLGRVWIPGRQFWRSTRNFQSPSMGLLDQPNRLPSASLEDCSHLKWFSHVRRCLGHIPKLQSLRMIHSTPFHRTVLWFNSSLSVLTQPFRLGYNGEFTPMFVGIRGPYASQEKIRQFPYNYGYIYIYI